MKLLYSATSPYVRKVRVAAREKGVQQQIEEILSNPFEREPKLLQANPLGKVPALILDNGQVLYDSPVICEYLDSLSAEPELLPTSEQRWSVLRAQALADGVLDVAVAIVLERRRPESEQSPAAIKHWQEQIQASVKNMPEQLNAIAGSVNLGHIAMAVALSYLDFRHDELQWRKSAAPELGDWHSEFSGRQSMQDTRPPA